MKSSINQRIKNLRKSLNLTQLEFSQSIGINHTSLSHIESDRNKPGFDIIHSILTGYESVSPDWLILGKGEMNRENSDEKASELLLQYFITAKRVYQVKERIDELTGFLLENRIIKLYSEDEIKAQRELKDKWDKFIKPSQQIVQFGDSLQASSCVNELQTFYEYYINHFFDLYDHLMKNLKELGGGNIKQVKRNS